MKEKLKELILSDNIDNIKTANSIVEAQIDLDLAVYYTVLLLNNNQNTPDFLRDYFKEKYNIEVPYDVTIINLIIERPNEFTNETAKEIYEYSKYRTKKFLKNAGFNI